MPTRSLWAKITDIALFVVLAMNLVAVVYLLLELNPAWTSAVEDHGFQPRDLHFMMDFQS